MAVDIKLDNAGIKQFFKSEAVASYLGAKAAEIASSASRDIDAHVRGRTDNPHVVGYSKVLSGTAVGVVATANDAAANVVAKHPETIKSSIKSE